MLIYSCIDILGWLDRPKEKLDNTREDFVNWVERYMDPDSSLKCSALDLYAARCSVLHTNTPSSSYLFRDGKAKKIFYMYGEVNEQEINNLIANEPQDSTIFIRVENLYKALLVGIKKFKTTLIISVFKSDEKMTIIHNRQSKFFVKKEAKK